MKIRVTKDEVVIEENSKIHKGEYNVNPIEFTFTSDYDNLIKKAIFETEKDKIEVSIKNDKCNIPMQVLQGKQNSFNLRVYGYKEKDNELSLRFSPTYVNIPLYSGSYIGNTTIIPSSEGGEVDLQTKSIEITNNGTQTVVADAGYDGLESVEITTNVPQNARLQQKETGIFGNGGFTITPDENYDGISELDLYVNVPSEVNNESMSTFVSQNGVYTYMPDEGYTGIGSLTLEVEVPTSANIEEKYMEITQNSTYSIAPSDGYDGINPLNLYVNVPTSVNLQEQTLGVGSNQTLIIEPDSGYNGISRATVNVDVPQSRLGIMGRHELYIDNELADGETFTLNDIQFSAVNETPDVSCTNISFSNYDSDNNTVEVSCLLTVENNVETGISLQVDSIEFTYTDGNDTYTSIVNEEVYATKGSPYSFSATMSVVVEPTQIISGQANLYYEINSLYLQTYDLYTKIGRSSLSDYYYFGASLGIGNIMFDEKEGYYGEGYPTLDDSSLTTGQLRFETTQQGQSPIGVQNQATKYQEITTNGYTTITPDSGYDCMQEVQIYTNVSGGGGSSIDLTSGVKFGYSNFYTLPNEIINANWTDITDMQNMFRNVWNITEYPLFDTSNITMMDSTFADNMNLITIPQFDTSNVYFMGYTFSNCTQLQNLPILDTSGATYMNSIVSNCPNLSNQSLDNIMYMCANANPNYDDFKMLSRIGLSKDQANICKTLSNYTDFVNAGWETGYEKTIDVDIPTIISYAQTGTNYVLSTYDILKGYTEVYGVELTLNDTNTHEKIKGEISYNSFQSYDGALRFDIYYNQVLIDDTYYNEYYFSNITYNSNGLETYEDLAYIETMPQRYDATQSSLYENVLIPVSNYRMTIIDNNTGTSISGNVICGTNLSSFESDDSSLTFDIDYDIDPDTGTRNYYFTNINYQAPQQ